MNDENIKKLFWERDESAIKELNTKYGNICLAIANNVLGNNADAEECVNDAYLATWNSIPPKQPSFLGAYVCKITKNLSLKKLDYNMALKRNTHYTTSFDELSECIAISSIDEKMDANELTECINRFLSGLDKENRVLFVRRYWYCETIDEIAKVLGINENNVSVKLYRTREKLRKFLLKEGINI